MPKRCDKINVEILEKELIENKKTKQQLAAEIGINISTIRRFIIRNNLKMDVCPTCKIRYHCHTLEADFCSNLCRFWSHVDKTNECWIWTGARVSNKNTYDYGRFGDNNKIYLAHRWIYEKINGIIPSDKEICHSCDNKLCINPSHLFMGSRTDNMQDASEKGRIVSSKTRKKYSNEFKKMVVNEYLLVGGLKSIAQKYKIHYTLINKWMKTTNQNRL